MRAFTQPLSLPPAVPAGLLAIGDALYTGSARIRFRGIPSFSPEVFAYVSNANPGKYKNYRKGLKELLEEGAVNMLRDRDDDGNGRPILAAVGQLQFDVVQYRLEVRRFRLQCHLEVRRFKGTLPPGGAGGQYRLEISNSWVSGAVPHGSGDIA